MADALQPGCKTPHWALGPKGRFHKAKRLKETTPLRH